MTNIFKNSLSIIIGLLYLSGCSKNNSQIPTDNSFKDDLSSSYYNDQNRGSYSVRVSYTNIQDTEGNIYKTVKFGSQEWMAENLRTRYYSNGDKIELAQNRYKWYPTTNGKYCVIDSNDAAKTSLTGRIYNYYCVLDSRGVCPKGWKVPSASDYDLLKKYADTFNNFNASWPIENQIYKNPNSDVGTNFISGSSRNKEGYGVVSNVNLSLWTTSKDGSNRGLLVEDINKFFDTTKLWYYEPNEGHSIRCIKVK